MTSKTVAVINSESKFAPIAAAFLAGAMLLAVAGFAQASALHDSAHDTRHAIAFPCH